MPTVPSLLKVSLLAMLLTLFGCSEKNPHYDPSKPHHTPTGFRNNYGQPPNQSILKWQWERISNNLPAPPGKDFPFAPARPELDWLHANTTEAAVTWIGHATSLVQLAGSNVLMDPVFSERASPFTFVGPKRLTPPGITLAQLPHIDVVVISHNHYDHLDKASVLALNRQAGGAPLFLVPLGVKQWMAGIGITNVKELDWWESTTFNNITLDFVPSQHWSARGLFDRLQTLWGGWIVKSTDGPKPYSVYFAGDTGYSNDFNDIHQRYPDIDLALIPIGAYAPRWFMQGQHIDPKEAVQIHKDLHARQSVGVHWGTFELTDEAIDEPPRLLKEEVRHAGLPENSFITLEHGQTLRLK